MRKLIYLASPYSDPSDDIRCQNYETVSKLAAKLCSEGHVVLSPITYGHTLCGFREMPTEWEFWENYCITLLEKCDEMIVYMMNGWEKSKGVTAEIKFCKENKIPITYLDSN